jgi:hypothetical protein
VYRFCAPDGKPGGTRRVFIGFAWDLYQAKARDQAITLRRAVRRRIVISDLIRGAPLRFVVLFFSNKINFVLNTEPY